MMNAIKELIQRIIPQKHFFGPEPAGKLPEAFSINLIRSKNFFVLHRQMIFFTALAYLMAQSLLFLFLFFWGMGLQVEAIKLHRDFQKEFPSGSSEKEFEAHLDDLYEKAGVSLKDLDAVIAIEKDKFQIAGKLAGIARTIPPRTWVTSIKLDGWRRSMMLEARFLVDVADPYQLPTKKWIDALKNDPTFGEGLEQIDYLQSSQTQVGHAEIGFFEIEARWQ